MENIAMRLCFFSFFIPFEYQDGNIRCAHDRFAKKIETVVKVLRSVGTVHGVEFKRRELGFVVGGVEADTD